MEIKKVIIQNGEYQCDIGVTINEWKEILQDETIMNSNYVDVLLKFYFAQKHESTCKELGIKYDKSPQSFNATITNFAKATQKKLNRFKVIRTNEKPIFWIIPMNGRNRDNHFVWTIRPELVKAIEAVLLNEIYLKFKKLLEYFISHLEWVAGSNTNNRGYNDYINPLIENNRFKKTGQGHKDDNIQNQILEWERYTNGRICINIQSNFGSYMSKKCYLNWEGTGINIIADWHDDNINSIYQEEYLHWLVDPKRKKITANINVNSLGLFDNNNVVTDDLKFFYNNFNKQIIDYNLKEKKNKQMQQIKPYIKLLEANKNLILTGAPGTGKTYLAKEIAKAMKAETEFVQFHPSFDYTDFVEGLRPTTPDENGNIGFELKDGIFKNFCKKALKATISNEIDNFDIAWEELLELIRDNLAEENLTKIGSWDYGLSTKDSLKYSSLDTPSQYKFTITKQNVYDAYQNRKARPSGAFQKDMKDVVAFMKEHLQLKNYQQGEVIKEIDNNKFIFIIDEINRAEISKVFGELFFSIDPGYRGKDGIVKTQYSNLQKNDDVFKDGFYVPNNVYIIGTMNDIDRSIESMDFAMRRRFAWQEIKTEDRISMWNGKIDTLKIKAKNRMNSLNKSIEEIQGLNSAYHIGPAYFLKLEKYQGDEIPFEHLWKNHLKGIIFEYLRGLPNSTELMNSLKNSYDLKSDDENI